ncbi:hypothetical protein AB0M58_13895 [Streptomyces bobili]|uniref:hypothetical protein n=1 Tax=Streptomyces bobili TaxID=67280 RepID=UPI0034461CD9
MISNSWKSPSDDLLPLPLPWECIAPPGFHIPYGANHWALTAKQHGSFRPEIEVAQATSHPWGESQNSPGPHCPHRAASLDSSAPRYTPMDPTAAQTCVERISQRRALITLQPEELGRAMSFAHDYEILGNTGQRHFPGGYRFYDDDGYVFLGDGGSSVGLPSRGHTQFATPHHSHLHGVRPQAADELLTEALKDITALWASPECPPRWTPAGRRPGGDA